MVILEHYRDLVTSPVYDVTYEFYYFVSDINYKLLFLKIVVV